MTTLHIITPVSRPGNLEKLQQSIGPGYYPDMYLFWWQMLDTSEFPSAGPLLSDWIKEFLVPSVFNGKTLSVAGNAQRNAALEQIKDGWVYFLDDDTTMHPDLLRTIAPILNGIPGCCLVFNQDWPDGSSRCTVSPSNMHQGTVDTGQVVLAREAIGDLRWDADKYHSDGPFIESVFRAQPEAFIWINRTLAIYNNLRI
jgi:hypothetical protein